jgi:ABC-type Fe3+ transport system permease subunit/streptogramin lyase
MNWVLLRNSLFVGSLTTLLSVTLGFMAALWLAALPGRLRPWFFAAAVGAFALPPFLVTNCWLHYLGHVGVWHTWLPFDLFSLTGSIWVLSLLLWPLSFFLIWGAWQRLEAAQLESDLLVRGGALMRVLLLPLAREAIILAAMLIFALALNNFAVPAILQVKVLPAEMWVRFNTEFDSLGALKAGYPLLIVPALLLLLFRRRTVLWPNVQGPVSGALFRRQLGPGWWCVSGCFSLALLFCSVILPLFQILSTPRTWSELSGAVAAGQGAIENSLLYSLAGATTVTGMALVFAAMQARSRDGTGARIANAFGMFFSAVGWLAFLLPGVLLGIGLIHAFNHDWSARIYQSGIIVIVAFTIRYFVVGHYAVGQVSRKVDTNLLDVAQIEGASRWQMLRHAIGPQIFRPLLVSWYLIFLLCLWDVESMILVVPPGGETLALRVFNLLHYGHNAQVNALCLTLLLVALLPLVSACLLTGFRAMTQRASALRWPKSALVLLVVSLLFFTACAPNPNQVSFSSNLFATVQVIGSRGVGVGQLNKPRSVAVDNSDNLYVVDMTGRVQKFSSNGVFLLSWQMPQIERGKPKGMGRDRDGNILVVEPHYSRVNVFSPLGQLLAQWGEHGTNAGQLSLPRGVAVNSHREFFVSEYQEIERVQKFAFADGSAARPEKAGLRPAPRFLGGFGQAGTAPGEFNRPEGLCVDAQDRLYVADSCNHRIQIFAPDGKFLRAYGKPGQGPGELSYPYDICVDKEGRQYVCEFGNSRIQVFDPQDRSIGIIGGAGAAAGRFSNPWGVALDSGENLYVADSQNHRVQKLIRRR